MRLLSGVGRYVNLEGDLRGIAPDMIGFERIEARMGQTSALLDRLRFCSLNSRRFFSEQSRAVEDECIQAIARSVAGFFHPGICPSLEYMITNLPCDAPIIEMGAFCGLYTNALAHHKARHGMKNTLIASDSWSLAPFEETRREFHGGDLTYGEFLRKSFVSSVVTFSSEDPPYGVEMTPDRFFVSWKAGEVVTDVTNREVKLGGAISGCVLNVAYLSDSLRQVVQDCEEFLTPGAFLIFADPLGLMACKSQGAVLRQVISSGHYDTLVGRACHLLIRRKPFRGPPVPHIS